MYIKRRPLDRGLAKEKKKQRKTSEEPNLTARKMDNYESDRPRNEFYNDSSY